MLSALVKNINPFCLTRVRLAEGKPENQDKNPPSKDEKRKLKLTHLLVRVRGSNPISSNERHELSHYTLSAFKPFLLTCV